MRKTPRGWIQIGESRTRGVARIPLGLKPSRDSRATSQQDSPIWIQPLDVFRYKILYPFLLGLPIFIYLPQCQWNNLEWCYKVSELHNATKNYKHNHSKYIAQQSLHILWDILNKLHSNNLEAIKSIISTWITETFQTMLIGCETYTFMSYQQIMPNNSRVLCYSVCDIMTCHMRAYFIIS